MGDTQFAIQVTVPVAVPRAIPKELSHLIHLNDAYGVLICKPCKQAVEPGALVRHLKRKHLVEKDIWRKAADYVKDYPWDYRYSTVDLPEDGSEAQAVLGIEEVWECEVWQCETCGGRPFRTSNWDRFQRHRIKEHRLTRTARADMGQKVLAQSWFLDGRQRYWRVKRAVETGIVDTMREEEAEGATIIVERDEENEPETGIIVGCQSSKSRPGRKRRRVTGISIHDTEVEGRRERQVIIANSTKRRASIESEAGECGPRKRVRFTEHADIRGPGALKKQLERWSKECPACYFLWPNQPSTDRLHTIWECRQPKARKIRMYSQFMDGGLRGARAWVDKGSCGWCGVPVVMCGRWQWTQERWMEVMKGRCQYEGVLMATIITMMELGLKEGAERVGELDWANREWFRRRVWWGSVEVQQAVEAFMILAQMNGLLQEDIKGIHERGDL